MDDSIDKQDTSAEGEPVNRRRKVSTRTKLLFASGALQEATVTAGGIVTILFYNQVLGVSASLAGTAYLIVSIFDAVLDPIVGTISDRFQSRWGRRHPFMFASALPIAVGFFFLYQPLDGLGETGLFIWLVAFFALVRLGQTLYLIPHDALGAELTDDYEERTSIFGYNNVGEMVLSMIIAALLYVVIFPTPEGAENGLLNEARYIILATAGSITILFSVLLCSFGTLDQLPYLKKVEISKKFVLSGYFQEIGTLLRNPSYLAACLSLLTIFIGLGIIGVVANYAYIYAFEFSSEEMFWAGMAKLPGVFVALPLLYFFSKFWEKKQIVIYTTVFTAVIIAAPYTLKLFGYFLPNDSPYILFAVFVPLLIGFMVFPVSYIVIDSQLADIADEHELNIGKRREGIIFSVRSFGKKATQGVGGFIAGFGLEFIGFPENAEVGNIPAEAIEGLLILNGPVYLVLYLVGISFMMMYRIDKKRHAEILTELEKRREAAAGADA
ncbi:MAG: MFS transporter [Woeseiaceae bacterium]